MKSLLLGGVGIALGVVAATAQTTTNPTPSMSPAPAASAAPTPAAASTPAAAVSTPAAAASTATASTDFITTQKEGQLRAPKLVGVAVYDSDNKSVGKIDDLLLDKSGSIQAVVIGMGGFLGIGRKDVAVPYSAIHWQTEQRTAAESGGAPAGAPGATNNSQPATQKIDPAKIEAYQGYPDRAVLNVTQAQLKAAPEFKYAQDPQAVTTSAAPAPATAKKP